MDAQRQAIFAKQLHATMAALTISQADPKLRAMVGSIANRLLVNSSTNTWADFKKRIDRAGYDKTLEALQDGGADMRRKQEPLGVRAMETIGVALIARHQGDEALRPVIEMLDKYIEQCVAAFRKADAVRSKGPRAANE